MLALNMTIFAENDPGSGQDDPQCPAYHCICPHRADGLYERRGL